MRKHSRGAVTVLVTLLLIPAILVSGTGVDLSRIYAARSVTRDANQLAANTVLTNYNRLLHDLYGLYAVIAEDDNLTKMVDTYVKASLFGEEVTDAQLGEFRLFSGTESVTSEVSSSGPLSNVDILRRQIEEYSKFRVPVAIFSDIIDRLQDAGTKQMKANNEATAKKIAVDEQLNEVLKAFKAVTDKAAALKEGYDGLLSKNYEKVNDAVNLIRKQFSDMLQVRKAYESETDADKRADLFDHYKAISKNIDALTYGGTVGYDWVPAHIDDEGNDVPGAWRYPSYQYSEGLKPLIDRCAGELRNYSAELDKLIDLCKAADAVKSELQSRLNALKTKLNDGTCSKDLKDNMLKELKQYEELLTFDFEELGQDWKEKANEYIDRTVEPLDETQGYGSISFENLKDVKNLYGFQIELNTNPSYKDYEDRLTQAVNSIVQVYTAFPNFPTFEGVSDEHKRCCDVIEKLGVKSDDELLENEKEEKAKFKDLFKSLQDVWKGLTDYDLSPGASKYTGSGGGDWAFTYKGKGLEMDFGLSDLSFGDTEEEGILSTLKTFTGLISGKIDIMEMFSNVLANASNRVLQVGYATQMFSNWTTKSGIESGKTYLSLTGQPIDASNNYFMNSEWEYLCNGNLDAKANLRKVTITIFVLRFLANYASSYMINGVNMEIQGYENAVSAIPFAGAALRFLVRPLIVLLESVVDVSLLRSGHAVPLLKTQSNADAWHLSLINITASLLKDTLNNVEGSDSKEKGMLYTDYVTIFLLVSEPEVIASRIGDLIALNVTTAKEKIAINDPSTKNVDERADAIASKKLFNLSSAYTTFAVQTQTNVRFVFLSMPFAQRGINGVVPSTTFPVNVTTYRGY